MALLLVFIVEGLGILAGIFMMAWGVKKIIEMFKKEIATKK